MIWHVFAFYLLQNINSENLQRQDEVNIFN